MLVSFIFGTVLGFALGCLFIIHRFADKELRDSFYELWED